MDRESENQSPQVKVLKNKIVSFDFFKELIHLPELKITFWKIICIQERL